MAGRIFKTKAWMNICMWVCSCVHVCVCMNTWATIFVCEHILACYLHTHICIHILVNTYIFSCTRTAVHIHTYAQALKLTIFVCKHILACVYRVPAHTRALLMRKKAPMHTFRNQSVIQTLVCMYIRMYIYVYIYIHIWTSHTWCKFAHENQYELIPACAHEIPAPTRAPQA